MTAADAQRAVEDYTRTLSGGKSALSAEALAAADVDGDKAVTTADAQLILQYYTLNSINKIPTDWNDLLPKTK